MKFCVGEKMSEVSGQYEVVSCQLSVVSGQYPRLYDFCSEKFVQ
ncbi:hypothetical protein [Candidatus Brachybacter algidus]|nr:hypothetical protein [Candidatus Brachybacter algidus]